MEPDAEINLRRASTRVSTRQARVLAPLAALGVLVAGDSGRIIFERGGCLRCHSIAGRGGSLGPDLSEIGLKRTAESLRRSIVEPDAEIERAYLTVVIATKAGERVEGVALNEDDLSIQVRDAEGNPRSFLKESISGLWREERSLMPSYAARFSGAEIGALVEYLSGLKGAFAPAAGMRKPGPLTTSTAWLTRANRDGQERPEMLLDSLRIGPGEKVADVGAGAGYFTWRLARRVGARGKVIAVDVQPAMVERIRRDVEQRGLENVEVVLGSERDPRLGENSLDLVLIANAYHEFSRPEAMMAAVRRSLKARGRVVVVEYSAESDEDPVAGLYMMTLEQIRGEIEPMGFRLERVLDFLPMQHGLIFRPAP